MPILTTEPNFTDPEKNTFICSSLSLNALLVNQWQAINNVCFTGPGVSGNNTPLALAQI